MRYDLSDFPDYHKPSNPMLGEIPLGAIIDDIPASLKKRLATVGGGNHNDASRQDCSDITALLKFGLSPGEAYSTFGASKRGKDAQERKIGHFDDYMVRTINKAMQFLGKTLDDYDKPTKKAKPRAKNQDDDDLFVEEDANEGAIHAPLPMVSASDVKPIRPKFFVHPYLPDGSLSILFGDPGTSKTSLAIWMMAALSRGKEIFGCPTKTSNVMLLSNEDPTGISVARFLAAGGDVKRLSLENFTGDTFALEHMGRLKATIKKYQPKVLVIDSVMSHVGGRADVYRQNEVAALMGPLQSIADQFHIVIIGLMHMNKQDAAKAIYRVGGSIGFVGTARSAMFLDFKPEESDRRILCHVKANYSAKGPSQEISVRDNGKGVPRIRWEGASELSADDLLAKPDREGGGKKLREAEEMLNDLLFDGPMASAEIYAEAESRGIKERSLERAKKMMGIVSEREKNSEGRWVWSKREKKASKN
jgi:RecA-family ATPase